MPIFRYQSTAHQSWFALQAIGLDARRSASFWHLPHGGGRVWGGGDSGRVVLLWAPRRVGYQHVSPIKGSLMAAALNHLLVESSESSPYLFLCCLRVPLSGPDLFSSWHNSLIRVYLRLRGDRQLVCQVMQRRGGQARFQFVAFCDPSCPHRHCDGLL